jgi:galactoside O-acetyltransferase
MLRELAAIVDRLVSGWPGAVGFRLRRAMAARRLGRLGARAAIESWVRWEDPANIFIGDHFSCHERCFIAAGGGRIEIGDSVNLNANVHVNASCGGRIVIGTNVLIGPNTVLRAAEHRFDRADIPIRAQGHRAGTITLEDDVWLAANVTVLPDVTIGRGAVVAAGAVVTSSVEPYTVVGGVPAKFLKRRGEPA